MSKYYLKIIKLEEELPITRALKAVRVTLNEWMAEIGYSYQNWKLELNENFVFNGERILEYTLTYDPGWSKALTRSNRRIQVDQQAL